MKKLLLLLLAVLSSLPLRAYDFIVNGIYYNRINDKECSVTYGSYKSRSYSGNVVIPESVTCYGTTYSVIEIDHSAFYNCTDLTSVTIPNSVKYIVREAFYRCTGLTSVTIPNSVTSIGEWAFDGCSLTSVHISDLAAWCNIEFQKYGANPLNYAHALFLNGEEVKDLVIPNSVTKIGRYAFFDCSGLTSVTIPNSVTTIGDYAFFDCSGLTSITIPNSVTTIGDYAFFGCSGLTSVTIPNSVNTIGDRVFSNCSGLKKLAYPNKIANPIPDSNAWAIEYPAEDAIIEDGWVYGPNKYAIYFAPLSLKGDYIMDSTVLSVGDKAFAACDGLTSLKTSIRLRTIGNNAFSDCDLEEIIIVPTVKTIGNSAFSNNPNLNEVKIGYGITEIGDKAFDGCNNIANVYITASKPPKATDNTFANYRAALWLNNKKTQNSYFDASDCWYWFGESMKSMVIAESVVIETGNIKGIAGDSLQLMARVMPEDATLQDVFWKSTNTDVATVNGNGLVTFIAPSDEECEIVAMSMYENVPVAEIAVTTVAASGEDPDKNSIAEIGNDSIEPAVVYDMRGVRVGESLEGLPHGVYIIRQGGKTRKILR